MNTKEIEKLGVKAFRSYIKVAFPSETVKLEDIRNKGNREKKLGCDLILSLNGQQYFIELKASLARDLPTNIRFTHQTLATTYNAKVLHKMIVAIVYNLAKGPKEAKFKFFCFGDLTSQEIYVEPHFIIQPKQIIKKKSKDGQDESPIKDCLEDILKCDSHPEYDVGEIFQTRVSDHMKLKRTSNQRMPLSEIKRKEMAKVGDTTRQKKERAI